MGGTFGDISDSIFDLGERFSGATAGVTGLGGAALVTAAGITAAGFAVGFAAKATAEWLDGMPDLIASLKDWEGARADLSRGPSGAEVVRRGGRQADRGVGTAAGGARGGGRPGHGVGDARRHRPAQHFAAARRDRRPVQFLHGRRRPPPGGLVTDQRRCCVGLRSTRRSRGGRGRVHGVESPIRCEGSTTRSARPMTRPERCSLP
jgi:hypothetical protein